MSPSLDPLSEDSLLCAAAEVLGLEISRQDAIEITDMPALEAAGMTVLKPDYKRIRRALKEGATVPGVQPNGIQYFLRRPNTSI